MVGRFAPVRRSDGQNEALVKSPLFVRHQISCQAGLHHRYQLESRSARPVNPFCQHDLDVKSEALATLADQVYRDDQGQPLMFDSMKTKVGIVTTKWEIERPMR